MICCYYPTTTVAIDDDIDFLQAITQHIAISDCILYSSPKKALDSLNFQKTYHRIKNRILKSSEHVEDDNLSPEDFIFSINLSRLHEEIYFAERFQDISVMIVDYQMSEINGIDLCEKLIDHPAKKILLTGGIDKEKVAIEAFNKGIINRFINKSDQNFPNLLKQSVATLKNAYFRDLSTSLIPYLFTETKQILQNATYINFITNLWDQFNAAEYYLIDAGGSRIYVDPKGLPTWLIIRHETEINNYQNLAQNQDVSNDLLEKLKRREVMPFFFTEEDYQTPVSQWNTFLYQAQPIPGIENHYYAIHKGHIRNNLNQEKVIAYANA